MSAIKNSNVAEHAVQSITSSKERPNTYNQSLQTIKQVCVPLPEFNQENMSGLLRKCMVLYNMNRNMFDDYARDMLYLSQLTALSACFHTVRIPYGNDMYSTNLSLVIAAPSASNKSVMKYAAIVLNKLNDFIINEYRDEQKNWKKKCEIWNQEKKLATQEKREPNFKLDPGDEPLYTCLVIPANASKSMIIMMMKGGEHYGTILITTEADTLNDANDKDYGNMTDCLNKALVNELVDKAHRIDGEPITIKYPMFGMLVSGTFDQTHRLIKTYETGDGSRKPVYLSSGIEKFVSQKPSSNDFDPRKSYEEIGEEVLLMWKFFSRFYFKVVFTDEQWEEHTEIWSSEFEDVKSGRPEMISVSTRFGLHHMRIAATLTMLRLWDKVKGNEEEYAHEFALNKNCVITCTDEDFQQATNIAMTLFNHTMTFSTSKVKTINTMVKEMENWHWEHEALKLVDDRFSVDDFMKVALNNPFNKSDKTVYRTLKKLSTGKTKVIKRLKTKVNGKYAYEKVNKAKNENFA